MNFLDLLPVRYMTSITVADARALIVRHEISDKLPRIVLPFGVVALPSEMGIIRPVSAQVASAPTNGLRTSIVAQARGTFQRVRSKSRRPGQCGRLSGHQCWSLFTCVVPKKQDHPVLGEAP